MSQSTNQWSKSAVLGLSAALVLSAWGIAPAQAADNDGPNLDGLRQAIEQRVGDHIDQQLDNLRFLRESWGVKLVS